MAEQNQKDSAVVCDACGLRRLKVLKFGGSSLGTSNGIINATEILTDAAAESRAVAVASAVSGVTNKLIELEIDWNRGDDERIRRHIAWLRERHLDLASSVLDTDRFIDFSATVDRQLRWLSTVIQHNPNDLSAVDGILAVGERLSVPLLSSLLDQWGLKSRPVDSTPLVRTNSNFGNARIDMDATTELLSAWFRGLATSVTPVVTGFLGSTSDGRTTTLGRSGSDYSASAVAVALGAHVVERWTDTDGVYSANPREDATAVHLPSLSLRDAIRRHRETGLGIHPKALDMLEEAAIPLHVRSTHSRQRQGSWILPHLEDRPAQPCKCDWAVIARQSAF